MERDPIRDHDPNAQIRARFEARVPRYVRTDLSDEERASYWERMPEEFRDGVEKKRVLSSHEQVHQGELQWRHRVKYGLAGGLFSAAFGAAQGDSSVLFRLVLILVGAAAAFLVAMRRIDHVRGTLIYGGSAIVLSILGTFTGLLAFDFILGFFCWLLWLAIGSGLSLVAEMEHQRRFTTY